MGPPTIYVLVKTTGEWWGREGKKDYEILGNDHEKSDEIILP